jgi:hypothetical protein
VLTKPKAIHIVYANWCPHCVPTTVEPLRVAARKAGLPCLLHDIDTDDEKFADDLVKKYGDWSSDYLIPQVFLEYEGTFRHVLTGNPRGIELTRKAVQNLIESGVLFGSMPKESGC